jgi:hypothetical protein
VIDCEQRLLGKLPSPEAYRRVAVAVLPGSGTATGDDEVSILYDRDAAGTRDMEVCYYKPGTTNVDPEGPGKMESIYRSAGEMADKAKQLTPKLDELDSALSTAADELERLVKELDKQDAAKSAHKKTRPRK